MCHLGALPYTRWGSLALLYDSYSRTYACAKLAQSAHLEEMVMPKCKKARALRDAFLHFRILINICIFFLKHAKNIRVELDEELPTLYGYMMRGARKPKCKLMKSGCIDEMQISSSTTQQGCA